MKQIPILICLWMALVAYKNANAQPGVPDATFGVNGVVRTDVQGGNDYGFGIAIQNDGSILVTGIIRVDSINNNFGLIRYKPDGQRDSSFGINGIVSTDISPLSDDHAHAVCIQTDGRIVVGGKSSGPNQFDFALSRYLSNGTPDSSFGINGIQRTDIAGFNDYGAAIKLQPDGKIVMAGYTFNGVNTGLALIRYHANGQPDSSFSGDGISILQAGDVYLDGQSLAIQPDGKIVAAATTKQNNQYDVLLIRLLPDGNPDLSFDGDGILVFDYCYNDYAYALALQSDGKILVGGMSMDTSDMPGSHNFTIHRFLTNGSIDPSYDGDGSSSTDLDNGMADKIYGITVQGNGKIVAVGNSGDGVNYQMALCRYLPDGSLDPVFGNNGIVLHNLAMQHEFGEAVAIQTDGDIVISGFIKDGTNFDIVVARYGGDMLTALSTHVKENELHIWPNPVMENFHIRNMSPGEIQIEVVNLNGGSFLKRTCSKDQDCVVTCSDWPDGLYFVRWFNAGDSGCRKILVSH